ncbi:hypothetical protein FIV42_20585 [Persicimonas caeni]|uniref:IgGFc-binding protein N-terminal domain-containing protein n=1 Tax=Persicimonas caeni TaxID=2292766 RepID=A0A4Y6PXJ3_PERCE|nr:IgGFc-binding protein [Persicimonas caeni]QDG53052.1 hypothetical protein FIV42_20585 [Persicimonas caeni]QED34274.1 hypothetical protein FRD00_20580 [Persicimonas caeni]
MLPKRFWCVFVATVTFGLLGLPGCSDEVEPNGDGECKTGETFNVLSGRCEPAAQPDASVADTSRADVTSTEDVGADADAGPDGQCTPGERQCADLWTLATCNTSGDGFDETNCGQGALCRQGRCEQAQGSCAAGERTCATLSEALVCADDGLGFDSETCESDELCHRGTCQVLTCVPSQTSCQGNDVVRCSDDGSAQTAVQTCGSGEVCEAGACVADTGPCANQKGYLGCEFLAADLDHMDPGDDQQFGISVSNSHTAPVDVTITTGDGSQVTSQTIAVGQLQTFELARRDVDNTGLTRQSYIVESTGPVTVHQFNPLNRSGVASTDASLLLPSHAIGTDYMVLGWPTTTSFRVTEGRAYFTIIAAEDATQVTVEPTAPIEAGGGVSALTPGQRQTFTLDRGQVLSLSTPNEAGHDLSGSTITSTKPVAVYSGSECADVPVGTAACDHLEQQLYPTDTWGATLVAAKFAPRDEEVDVYRLIASQDGTQVSFTPAVGGSSQTTLDRGQVYEFSTAEHFLLEASAPVLLGQFMVGASDDGVCSGLFCSGSPGDPAFLLNVSTRQYRSDYIVLIPAGFGDNFLSITAPTGTSVSVDGQAVSVTPSAITGTNWQVYQVPVGEGVHRVEASQPVGLTAHGYDQYVSYAYPGGLSLEAR